MSDAGQQTQRAERAGDDTPRSLNRLDRPLRGLEKVCKLYGRMKCGDVMMAWDYANNVALPEKELRADKPRWAASEKAKWSIGRMRDGGQR